MTFNVYFLCLVIHVLCVYALKLLSGFFEERSLALLGEYRLENLTDVVDTTETDPK